MKNKTLFVCANCGFSNPRWQGKCPECDQWNTFEEQAVVSTKSTFKTTSGKIQKLSDIETGKIYRIDSGISEFNQVLGGGIVPGSLILLGGDPGIGKSTLALQIAMNLQNSSKEIVYVSGEESAQQIKMRSARLSKPADIAILAETNLETVLATLENIKPSLAVIDSIQTLSSENSGGVVGGVSQMSFVTNSLMRLAKQYHITLLVIGHVTKEGMLAGPKTIEHMVDVVLYLEGDRLGSFRLLRSSKNRFGSVGEVGVFEMKESGLVEVQNPGSLFLEDREDNLSGSCITAALEGNKVLLLEIQGLTATSGLSYPKRAASGFDSSRLQLLSAILQKVVKVNLGNQDIYVNVTGGFEIDERAADLPVALAVLSSFYGKTLPAESIAFGEVGLLGEVRGVSMSEKRLKECEKLGFKNIFMGGKKDPALEKKFPKLKINFIKSVDEFKNYLK